MAVGLEVLDTYHKVKGVQLGIAQAGIKYPQRDDLVIIALHPGSRVSGVFTLNAFCAAPVHVAKQHLAESGDIRYLVINTGNANAGTGEQGMSDALRTCAELAGVAGCEPQQVLPFSTGVIGEHLPMDALCAGLPKAFAHLGDDHWAQAAAGIMTTDTLPKGYSNTITLDGQDVCVSGISKGSGMICPNMATMLGFITTDLAISQPLLDELCRELADQSFNRISVDGDTSTNDACILAATGQSGAPELTSRNDPHFDAVYALLLDAFTMLAHAIIRDGEGATKFVTIDVDQARTCEEARQVAYTVAHSPLVKTALFASDANWGRLLMAVGRSGVQDLDVDLIDVYLDDVCIAKQGSRAPSYTEQAGSDVFAKPEFTIRIVLGRGTARDCVWTSDLSHEYVTINAEYRT